MFLLILIFALLFDGCGEKNFNYVRLDVKIYPQYLLDESQIYHNIVEVLSAYNFQVRYYSAEYIDTDFRYHTFDYNGLRFIVRDRCFVWIRRWGWEYNISFSFTLQWGTSYKEESFHSFAEIPQEFLNEYKEMVALLKTLCRND